MTYQVKLGGVVHEFADQLEASNFANENGVFLIVCVKEEEARQ